MAQQSTLLLTTVTTSGFSSATSAVPVNPIEMLPAPASYIGDPVRADGWYGRVDHLYTIACYVSNLVGTVSVEASLADNPQEQDWFPVMSPISFPRIMPVPVLGPDGTPVLDNTLFGPGETASLTFNFRANVTWIRSRVDNVTFGYVDRILLNQ